MNIALIVFYLALSLAGVAFGIGSFAPTTAIYQLPGARSHRLGRRGLSGIP